MTARTGASLALGIAIVVWPVWTTSQHSDLIEYICNENFQRPLKGAGK